MLSRTNVWRSVRDKFRRCMVFFFHDALQYKNLDVYMLTSCGLVCAEPGCLLCGQHCRPCFTVKIILFQKKQGPNQEELQRIQPVGHICSLSARTIALFCLQHAVRKNLFCSGLEGSIRL